jgi:HSP20 family protein
MTIYVTPFSRQARNRWRRMMQDENYPEYQNDVYFPVDVIGESDDFIVKAMLPGVNSDDLNIQIVNETVTISGELTPEHAEDTNFLLHELPHGHFSRTLTLPAQLDSGKADAHLEDGVLTLRIPKAEIARPKMIKVNAK